MLEQLTACITTWQRPDSLQRLVASIKRFYPALPILIEDTGGNLSAGRNRLAERCPTPFYLMLEDDFVFTARTQIERLMQVVVSDTTLGGAAGVTDEPKRLGTANRGGKIWWDRDFVRIRDRVFLARPHRSQKRVDRIGYQPCDLIINFGVFRTDMLRSIRWDEELPVQEHTDYYWRVFLDARWSFAHCNSVEITHIRDRPGSHYNRARQRNFNAVIKRKLDVQFVKDSLNPQLGASNIVLLGVGRSNTTITTRMLATMMSLNLGDVDAQYGEEKNVRFVNQRQWKSGSFDRLAAERAIRKIPQPWIIKDPRFRRSLHHWLPVFKRYKPLLIYLTKDPDVVRASHQRAGWLHVYDRNDITRCENYFRDWPYAKIKLSAEKIAEAIALFDTGRVAFDANIHAIS
jgi:hypothetical protein